VGREEEEEIEGEERVRERWSRFLGCRGVRAPVTKEVGRESERERPALGGRKGEERNYRTRNVRSSVDGKSGTLGDGNESLGGFQNGGFVAGGQKTY
jgi:hypothetical protein